MSGSQYFNGYLPCRAPLALGCLPSGTADFVYTKFQPIGYGEISFQISVLEGGFTYKTQVLTVHVEDPPLAPYWEPNLLSIEAAEARVGDQQLLTGEGFIPPPPIPDINVFVVYQEAERPDAAPVFAEIVDLSPTEIIVKVPHVGDRTGVYHVYTGWYIPGDAVGSSIVSAWKDTVILPSVPTAVDISRLHAFSGVPPVEVLLLVVSFGFLILSLRLFARRR